MLEKNYSDCRLDYVILQDNEYYDGYSSHKVAVIKAFEILNGRSRIDNYYNVDSYYIKEDKLSGKEIDVNEFLALPIDPYYMCKPEGNRCIEIPSPLPYWYAFLEPPYGNSYAVNDFVIFNNVLFPFKNALDIYRWEDDFSDYFNDGKEWWGTGCWSVYDRVCHTFVVILASLTD